MNYKSGDKLCSCTLLQPCGQGGYGEVWLAEDAIGTKVALKILRGKYSEKEVAGLKHYKDCNHPNLLKIRHVEISENLLCCTMDAADDLNHGQGEYLPDTLANRLNRSGRLDGREISEMLNCLLDGLEELHSRGLVHRDIKPDNILWVNHRPTLSDAGLVAPIGKHTLIGTPGFVSPGVLESGGRFGPGDDFYALSKVVYCALTALPPAEYPVIPPEMTISLDPQLNSALLAGCRRKVNSAAEFRSLIQAPSDKTAPRQHNRKVVTVILTASVVLLLTAVFWGVKIYTNTRQRTTAAEPAVTAVAATPAAAGNQADFPRSPQQRFADINPNPITVQTLPDLLKHELISPRAMLGTVFRAMNQTSDDKILSEDLTRLHRNLSIAQLPDNAQLKVRQQYYRQQSAPPEELLDRIANDPVMQLAAVNRELTSLYHMALQHGFDVEIIDLMQGLLDLQNDYIIMLKNQPR